MKKCLAKAVLMSLVCASTTTCNVEAAQGFFITDTGINEVTVDEPGVVYIRDNSTSTQTGYNSDSESSIKKFTVDNAANGNQVTIILIKRNDRYSVNSYATLENKANTVVNGVLTIHKDAIDEKAIDNSGTIKFNDEVRFNSQIYNSSSGKFVSESYLHGTTLYSDVNHTAVESFGNIVNEGEMEINGRYQLVSSTLNNNAIGDVVINNSGEINIKSNSNEESKIRGTVINSGNANIILNAYDSFDGKIQNNGGSVKIINNADTNISMNGVYGLHLNEIINNAGTVEIIGNDNTETNLGNVINSGNLTIDTYSAQIIGNVTHNTGATTKLILNKVNSNNIGSTFEGNIRGSNNGGFELVLGKNTEWYVLDQDEPVTGVILDGGSIVVSDNYNDLWDDQPNKVWKDEYNVLTLNNFKSNGVFKTFNAFDDFWEPDEGIYLYTDLKNRIGDKVVFTGTTPNGTIPLGIINKNDNNGIPIKREDGYSVTVVEAPSDTEMKFSSNVFVYGTSIGYHDEEYNEYNGDHKVYKAQIDEIIEGNTKYWNFVGWEESEDNRTGEQEVQKEAIEHSILVEDVEPIFKRFNDLRTDPSEIGVWVRGETGETKIRNLSYDHNIMSGGYDWDYKNDAGVLFAGVGFTYSTNECDDKATGDTKGYGFNVYGSWLGKKNNDYVDLVVKYGKLDKSYAGYDENNIFVAGDYDKDLFTIAAKYGRRIFKDDWYYEPSVGLTWGRVGSADFTDNYGTRIHADNSYSNIASLGIQVGKNIKGIEYYGKAEVMHDFDGKIHVSAPGRSVEDDMGGTWVKCAIGASRKIDENNSFYLEVERDFGNKVEKPYGFSAGYRFTW